MFRQMALLALKNDADWLVQGSLRTAPQAICCAVRTYLCGEAPSAKGLDGEGGSSDVITALELRGLEPIKYASTYKIQSRENAQPVSTYATGLSGKEKWQRRSTRSFHRNIVQVL